MIQRVLAPNAGPMTGAGTNTYLVHDGAGSVAVVDPGPDDARHLHAVLDAARPLGRIVSILVTHGHLDHLPGALPLCERTGAPLVGHARLPRVNKELADGDEWAVGRVMLTAFETPGHTDDSLCYWEPSERALFTGDLVAGAGTVIVDDSPGGLVRYMSSLERLLALGGSRIYPGHGPIVDDGPGKLREYLSHRSEREQQILQVLARSGPTSVRRILEQVYVGLARELMPMAERNVRAHLDKLMLEGRAAEQAGAWRLT
jgi:glyoxylase-like metal-dependent hydrolase (beta-lactamase superfamily II)